MICTFVRLFEMMVGTLERSKVCFGVWSCEAWVKKMKLRWESRITFKLGMSGCLGQKSGVIPKFGVVVFLEVVLDFPKRETEMKLIMEFHKSPIRLKVIDSILDGVLEHGSPYRSISIPKPSENYWNRWKYQKQMIQTTEPCETVYTNSQEGFNSPIHLVFYLEMEFHLTRKPIQPHQSRVIWTFWSLEAYLHRTPLFFS